MFWMQLFRGDLAGKSARQPATRARRREDTPARERIASSTSFGSRLSPWHVASARVAPYAHHQCRRACTRYPAIVASPRLLAGFQPVQTLDQDEPLAVLAHQDRGLLTVLQDAFGDLLHFLWIELRAPFHRHVDVGDRKCLTLHHDVRPVMQRQAKAFSAVAEWSSCRHLHQRLPINRAARRSPNPPGGRRRSSPRCR